MKNINFKRKKNMVFQSSNPWAEIFISIGEWCPTGCQSCSKTLQKNKQLKLGDIQSAIDISHSLSDENFSYFLYGTNNIKNPEVYNIAQYIESLSRNYKVQIPIQSSYQDILHLIKNNKLNIFIISKKISKKTEILDIITSIKTFFWRKNIFINYDLLIDLEWKGTLERILKAKFEMNSEGIYELDLKNMKISLRSLYYINYKEKNIENLKLHSCLINDSFEVYKDSINVNDHIEIEPNLDITFHNPLCYIGRPKISNIAKQKSMILKDFSVYKNTYLKRFNKNMNKSCFECITNGYHY